MIDVNGDGEISLKELKNLIEKCVILCAPLSREHLEKLIAQNNLTILNKFNEKQYVSSLRNLKN